jgi:hypothetical protein
LTILAPPTSAFAGLRSGQVLAPCLPYPQIRLPLRVLVLLTWRSFTLSTALPMAFGYYAASVLPSARWHFRGLFAQVERRGSSPVPTRETCIVTLSCLLYAERIRDNTQRFQSRCAPRLPILGQVYQPLIPVYSHGASNAGFSRQHRSQDWSVNRLVVSSSRTFVRGLQTPRLAAPERLPRGPCTVVRVQLLWSNLSRR